jgi:hypothetical protein
MKYCKFDLFVLSLLLLVGLMACSPNGIEPVPNDSCQLVKITETPADSLQLDNFDLKTITITGDTLVVEIAHGGGCQQHAYALFMSPSVFLESFPVQANLYFQHNANGDLCKALLQQKICFDLRPVAELYHKFYHHQDPIRLNVFGYLPGQLAQKLTALYQPR